MMLLDAEKVIGIDVFLTPHKGLGGKLRTIPEDFIVSEVSKYPAENVDGRFSIAEITATNWETNRLIREFSKRLHISRKRIGFAGTKDKRARGTRLMSFYNVSEKDLESLNNIKDVVISNIYSSNNPVKIGNLIGNSFEIVIRNINSKTRLKDVKDINLFLEDSGGFPNFYGIQRFGIIRPITHIVGKHIVFDNFEKAVMSYIGNPIEGEDSDIYELRDRLQKTRNFSEALNSYPDQLNFEKTILNKLVVNPEDFVGAMKELPNNLLTMFIYAYQSYLFNRIISERIKRNIPINKAIIGDYILPVRKGVIDENIIFVSKNNVEKVNKQISRGKAFVSGPLFGSDTVFSEGEMGEIEHSVVDGEGFDPRDFIIPEIPFISSSGSRRPLISNFKNFEFKLEEDEMNKGRLALRLKFELSKGVYATSLLREFMKAKDIKNY